MSNLLESTMDPEQQQQQQLLLFTDDEEPFHKFTESDLDFLSGEEGNYSSNYVNDVPNKFYIFSCFFPLNQLFAHSYVFPLHLNTDSFVDAITTTTTEDTSYASYLTNDVWFHTQQQRQEQQTEAETEHNACEQLQPIDFSVERLDENGIHNDSNMSMPPVPMLHEKVVQQLGENNIQQGSPCICCYTLCLLSSLLPEEPCHSQSCGCQDVSLLCTPMHGIDST